jgi:sugar porter (SP) family MFS transporter
MKKSINMRYVLFLASTAALGGLLFGFDIAIITGAGPFIARQFGLSDLGLGGAYSSLLFGCVVGSLVAGKLADRFGRRRLLIQIALLFSVSSVAVACSNNIACFIAARFLGGIAVGGVSLLSPLYVAEIAPSSVRGRLGALYQMSIIVGIVVSYTINYLLLDTGAGNWRWMFLTGVAPSLVFLLAVILAPETPRFLVMKGKLKEAFRVLERISGEDDAYREIAAIQATIEASEVRPGRRERSPWGVVLQPGLRRALIISSCLAVLVQLSGVNIILDYAPAIFESAGWHRNGAFASTVVIGMTEFVFTLVSLWMIDKYGRKPLYIVGSTGMAFSLASLVAAVLLGSFHGVLALVLILLYLAFFASCIGPVFWTLVPELFPNRIRGTAMSIPVLIQWLANAGVVLLFPLVFHAAGKAFTFGFLALMALAQGVFAWLCVPETKNRTLEEIETLLGGVKTVELAGARCTEGP